MTKEWIIESAKKRGIIIFGAGQNGLKIAKVLHNLNISIKYFCDNDIKKSNQLFLENIRCIDRVTLNSHRDKLIIISILEAPEVYDDLVKNNFKYVVTWEQVYKCFEEEILLLEEYPYIKGNGKFKDIHKGKRCFVLGNGPSIKEQDLSLLKDEITFTVNFFARNPQVEFININYHVFADPDLIRRIKVSDKKSENMESILNIGKYSKQRVECFVAHVPIDIDWEKEVYPKSSNVNINFFKPVLRNNLAIDFTQPISGFYTVVQYAITLAIFMGCSEIYLLGCECTDVVNIIENHEKGKTSGKYIGYECTEAYNRMMREVVKENPIERQIYGVWRWFKDYEIIASYCMKNNIKLRNCTRGGVLECIEREVYEEVVGTNRLN